GTTWCSVHRRRSHERETQAGIRPEQAPPPEHELGTSTEEALHPLELRPGSRSREGRRVSESPTKAPQKRRKFQAIRGTRDLLPNETALWNRVEQTAHAVFNVFGFGEIRLPIFEPNELFARAVGDDTDIVGKEMYRIADFLELVRNLFVGKTRYPSSDAEASLATEIKMLLQI